MVKDKIDRTVIGAAGGIVGGLAFILAVQLFSLAVKGPYPKILHIAHLFIPPGQDHVFWGKVIGHIAHFTVSALLGIIFINIFRLTGKDWATAKGLIYGAALWIIIYGVMGVLLRLPQKASISVSFIILTTHLIYGLFTSWSVLWFSEKAKL